ncbi:hypothetical protein MMC10_010687 [Thelotrema lepadinum]|nr:hypothetical protein [Thelotrema lepadinum]
MKYSISLLALPAVVLGQGYYTNDFTTDLYGRDLFSAEQYNPSLYARYAYAGIASDHQATQVALQGQLAANANDPAAVAATQQQQLDVMKQTQNKQIAAQNAKNAAQPKRRSLYSDDLPTIQRRSPWAYAYPDPQDLARRATPQQQEAAMVAQQKSMIAASNKANTAAQAKAVAQTPGAGVTSMTITPAQPGYNVPASSTTKPTKRRRSLSPLEARGENFYVTEMQRRQNGPTASQTPQQQEAAMVAQQKAMIAKSNKANAAAQAKAIAETPGAGVTSMTIIPAKAGYNVPASSTTKPLNRRRGVGMEMEMEMERRSMAEMVGEALRVREAKKGKEKEEKEDEVLAREVVDGMLDAREAEAEEELVGREAEAEAEELEMLMARWMMEEGVYE